MKRNRFVTAVVGAAGAAVLLAGCTGSGPTDAGGGGGAQGQGFADIEAIKLTVSNIHAETSTSGIFLSDWMKAVTEKTEGKVTFDYYGGGTLHPATEGLSALDSGLTDITFLSTGYFPDKLKIAQWDDKVFQDSTRTFGYPGMNTAGIPAQLAHYGEGSAVEAEFADSNFMPMLPMTSGPAVLTCSEPFESLDDLAGRQVRVANDVAKGENEALGMTGVFIPPNEQYEALQRAVVNCAVNAPTTVLGGSLLEVAKYSTFTENAPASGSMFAIAHDVWTGLPDVVKQAMLQARNEAVVNFTKNTLDVYKKYVEATEAAGGKIVDSTPFNKKINAWHDQQGDLAGKAPSGVEGKAAVDRVKKISDDWNTYTTEELGIGSSKGLSIEDQLAVYAKGSGGIDWDAYLDKLNEYTGVK